jgi:putative transposase
LPAQFRLPTPKNQASGKKFVAYDRLLDGAEHGPLWLKEPRIAEAMSEILRAAEKPGLFKLQAYVVMANHVHLLLEPRSALQRITRQIKGASAHSANQLLGRRGARFWQDESFDHWIRTPQEWQKIRTYIERNPVSAGLVTRPEDWPWSSASNPL